MTHHAAFFDALPLRYLSGFFKALPLRSLSGFFMRYRFAT
jgi:hypothetical protein